MIDSNEVHQMIMDCLYKSHEIKDPATPPEGCVVVQGLTQKFGFHPERLAAKKGRLIELIEELHPNFTEGGGWTFLNLPSDKRDQIWGQQRDAEALLAMCIGNQLAEYQIPREMWDAFPGGMPYVRFSKTPIEKKEVTDGNPPMVGEQAVEHSSTTP